MLKDLFERQSAINAQVEKYAPIRDVFEEFLKAGNRVDAGSLWWVSPGARKTRFNWENNATVKSSKGKGVVVRAFTDPDSYYFGYEAGDVQAALINMTVSLPENQHMAKELELPPVWAILEQYPDFSPEKMAELTSDLEEIVPLVRACLVQG